MQIYSPRSGKRWVEVRGYEQAKQVNAYIQATEQLRSARTAAEEHQAVAALDQFKDTIIRFGNYEVHLLTDPEKLIEVMKAEPPLERYKQQGGK